MTECAYCVAGTCLADSCSAPCDLDPQGNALLLDDETEAEIVAAVAEVTYLYGGALNF